MNYKLVWSLLFGCFFLLFIAGTVYGNEPPYNLEKIPLKGMVAMIDLGAKSCIPCKMMAPILAKLEKVYDGKAAIVFIDVWKHRGQAKRFRIRAFQRKSFLINKVKRFIVMLDL